MTTYLELLEPHVRGSVADRLVVYAELLERWSDRHNLVRFSSRNELVERHLLDALAGAELMTGARTLLDIGSGAGLPAIPLLCACPGLSGTLLEPRRKRWTFLRLVVRELGLGATVEAQRYQDLEPESGPWDRITARALGDHDALLEAMRSRLTAAGAVVLWVTQPEVERLENRAGWRVVGFPMPRSDRGRLAYLQPCST